VAKKAARYLITSGIGDTAYFGPEAEFFVFDDVRFSTDSHHTFFKLDSAEGPHNTGRDYPKAILATGRASRAATSRQPRRLRAGSAHGNAGGVEPDGRGGRKTSP